jgi:eukaryotic-like serine/threonine-protein kinase
MIAARGETSDARGRGSGGSVPLPNMSSIPSREEALFADALAQPPAQRGAFLAQACGDNLDLLCHLVALVAAHEGPESLMVPATLSRRPSTPEEKPGDMIGRYKLLQKIGEGGCGVVWMAEQEEPVRRRVALKVIKLGMDTKAVIARFEAERQALAMMDHPNIAKVLDGGATETGRPFFVMELVRGIPITKYCDENHLTPTARLELFVRVCQAVQHAHQKGIIHRDLKPSNILVTVNDGVATPKVIDFGIAKATQGRLTDATVFTAFEQFIGTPVYMSPEQAEMSSLDIDTRSDIYSLGVLLYELLTGRPPFDPKAFAKVGVDQIRQQIRETEPLKPSTRLATLGLEDQATIAKFRATVPGQLSLLLRGDLDWIVMRCLEKDRTRRYDTANGLAMDVERHLRNEPVVARPPSTAYLLQKLFRRHRLAFAAGSAIACSLVAGLGVSVWSLLNEKAARQRAVAAEHDALTAAGAARRAELKAQRTQTLADGARRQAENLVGFLLDDFYEELEHTGRLEVVGKLAQQAVAYYEGLPPELQSRDSARNRALAMARQGVASSRQGRLAEGDELSAKGLAEIEQLRSAGDESEATTIALAVTLLSRRLQGVQPRRAVELLKPFGATDSGTVRNRKLYAEALLNLGRSESDHNAAIDALTEARRILAEIGALDLSNLNAASAYAHVCIYLGRRSEPLGRISDAERYYREALTITERVLAARPSDMRALYRHGNIQSFLSRVEETQFRFASAQKLVTGAEEATKVYLRFEPSDSSAWANLLSIRMKAGELLAQRGHIQEALAKFRAAAGVAPEQKSNAEVVSTAPGATLAIARWAGRRGNRSEAEAALAEALRERRALARERQTSPTDNDLWMLIYESVVVGVKYDLSEYDLAVPEAKRSLARIENFRREERFSAEARTLDGLRRFFSYELGRALVMLERFAEAEEILRQRLQTTSTEDLVIVESNDAMPREWLAIALARQNRRTEALEVLGPGLAYYRERWQRGDDGLFSRWNLARGLFALAISQPEDANGRGRRETALDEASSLLDGLSDQAKELNESRVYPRWIAAERARSGN